MKKILIAAVITVLSVTVVIQALKLRRLRPAEDYEYVFNPGIDADYHDLAALKHYYFTGYAVGSFAREVWKDRGINVRFPDSDDATDKAAVAHYNGLKAAADSLGARLVRSKELKAMGLNNADIRRIDQEGVAVAELLVAKTFGGSLLQRGDRNGGVYRLQAKLIEKGYKIPHDGYLWDETELAIKDFQSKQQLFPSGAADRETLEALLSLK